MKCSAVPFESKYISIWDGFVATCKNASFLFYTDYFTYHKERFEDASLLVLDEKNAVVAIVPAHKNGSTIYTHQGLTFGGIAIQQNCILEDYEAIWQCLMQYWKSNGIQQVVYKKIPLIYCSSCSDEDEFMLLKYGASVSQANLSSVLNLNQDLLLHRSRRGFQAKIQPENYTIHQDEDWEQYWNLLTAHLEVKHHATPVHSIDEITKLKAAFPNNISLRTINIENKIAAGAVIYDFGQTVRSQYLATSDDGRKLGALDALLVHLIKHEFVGKNWFDMGTSAGVHEEFNKGLLFQKEGFGARPLICKIFQLNLL